MAFNIFRWLIGNKPPGRSGVPAVDCDLIFDAACELQAREMAFAVCVNMIANAVGKCEFKTYRGGVPYRDAEYYLWNVEPNINQNSSAFLHELVYKLYRNNEALIIPVRQKGEDRLMLADSWERDGEQLRSLGVYGGVTIANFSYSKKFYEDEVLHLVLNAKDVRAVLNALYGSYAKLLAVASDGYIWSGGNHLKVHVDQLDTSSPEFARQFADYMAKQVKPWMDNPRAVLPEFNGYTFSEFGNRTAGQTTRDIRALYNDIFDFTAQGFGIPPVLLTGSVADSKDAMGRWLTDCIDPLCAQLEEEATRKRYGYAGWKRGDYLSIDTSTIQHFDLFANAANVEKLIGSGCYSINDVLQASGQPALPYDWAGKHWLTLNIGTMEQAARAAENGEKGGSK